MPITTYPTTIYDVTVPIRSIKWGDLQEGSEKYLANASVTYRVDWGSRWLFLQQINGIFGSLIKLPMQYPDFPGLLVQSTSVKGVGYVSCGQPYKYAEVTASFATPTYDTTGDQALLTIEYDSGSQIITCPTTNFTLGSGSPLNSSVGINVPNTTINITRHRVALIDTATFETCVGKINSSVFFGRAAKTVLCLPIKSSSQISIGGSAINEVTFSFAWRAVPWDQILNTSMTWTTVTPNPYGTPTDLTVLFN